jgi:hypothetical protein
MVIEFPKIDWKTIIYVGRVSRLLFSSPCFERRRDPAVAAMDLGYHKNTASQGWASMRQHQAWHPLHLMASNLAIPSTVLDFPTLDEFRRELTGGYDAVCISFGAVSARSLLAMVRETRRLAPGVPIVVGGYGTDLLDKSDDPIALEIKSAVDEICRGEGVAFLREFVERRFGIASASPLRQDLPLQELGFGAVPGSFSRGLVLVAALGCRNRCEFCSTSHHFQGRKTTLLTPTALCGELVRLSGAHPGVSDVLVFDEDLLADRDQAMELARLLDAHPLVAARNLRITIFASIRSLQRYTVRELVAMRIGMVFIGIESVTGLDSLDGCSSAKRGSEDPVALFRRLHAAGIHTIASVIGGWEGQSSEDLAHEAERFAALNPTLYQVMPLTALPGTPLWDRHKEDGLFDSDNSWRRPEAWGNHLGEWIDRTNRMLVEEGGPWFFRMAENHLQAIRSPLSERHERENSRRLADLEPLALASGLFFHGKGFHARWRRYLSNRLRSNPLGVAVLMPIGIALSAALRIANHACRSVDALTGANGIPRSRKTKYPGTRESTRCA